MSARIQPNPPILSVIIPTRERADTLAYTLATTIEQESRDFEILVSDNASADGTADLVRSNTDPRLRYINTGRRMSMCDNYEFALEHASGEYIIIIGDDDAVILGGLDYLLNRFRHQAEPTIHTWQQHEYDWPVGERKARLSFLAPQGPERTVPLKDKARWVMRRGGWKYYELPSPYHSAVPRRILDAIRNRTGRVFHSTQPDVFTAMAIPAFADYAINVGKTITMSGRSGRSNGLGFITPTAHSNIDRFIGEYGNYRFHPTLSPELPQRANMIPDAFLLAKDMFPEIYDDLEFGYEAMLAYMCRLRFASHFGVLRNAASIRERHPLRLRRFLRHSGVHQAAVFRRRLLNSMASDLHDEAPANIYELVRRLREIYPLPAASS